MTTAALSWADLEARSDFTRDTVNGPTNAQATLRLFGQSEADVRVTLYRDNHAWCPYCQKVWLWLEEKRIPYRIKKVHQCFATGKRSAGTRKKVPSGMLPALDLDGRLVTESDDILLTLESAFGPLNQAMEDPQVLPLRQLERLLFRAWCMWLCYPNRWGQDRKAGEQFKQVVAKTEAALSSTPWTLFFGGIRHR